MGDDDYELDNDLSETFRRFLANTTYGNNAARQSEAMIAGTEAHRLVEEQMARDFGFPSGASPRHLTYDIETQPLDSANMVGMLQTRPRSLSGLGSGEVFRMPRTYHLDDGIRSLYPEVMRPIKLAPLKPRFRYETLMTCQFVDSAEKPDSLSAAPSLDGVSDDKIKLQTGFSRISRKTVEVKR